MGCLTLAFSGPKEGGIAMSRLRLRGSQKRGQKQNWLPHPAFLGAQKEAELPCNPYVPGVSRSGDKIRIGCLTPAFSGV